MDLTCKFGFYETLARVENSTLLRCNVPDNVDERVVGQNISVTLVYGANREVNTDSHNNWLTWIDVIRLETLSRSVGA